MKNTKIRSIAPSFLLIPLSVLPLVACSTTSIASSSESEASTFDGTTYYNEVEKRSAFDPSNAHNINESFVNGAMSDSYWNALSGVWQNDNAAYPHNGVQSRNLFYTKSSGKTLLGFKGRGIYSSDSDTKIANDYRYPEGACIVSKNHLGPGRYEIEMAAMPREGGVTAMWTYCTETGNEATSQNEIDIEIGGNTSETYMREWCTTWTKHTTKATKNVDVSSLCYLNDGLTHKYTFDWYTDYKKGGSRRVDWFIDGVLIATDSGEEVPETEMPLWVGLWFPNWCSSASFDTDYMLVSSIKYTAFESSQYVNSCRAKSGYTQVAPSQAGIQSLDYEKVTGVNKLANGGFESLDVCKQDKTYFGWQLDNASKGTLALSSDKTTGSKSLQISAGTGTDNTHGEYLMQKISNAFQGYKFAYSFDAKKLTSATDAQTEFHFSTIKGGEINSTQTIKLDSTDWKTYSGIITMPEKAGNLRMDLVVNDGSALFDNASIKYLGKV